MIEPDANAITADGLSISVELKPDDASRVYRRVTFKPSTGVRRSALVAELNGVKLYAIDDAGSWRLILTRRKLM